MAILIYSLFLFCFALFLHLIIWKVCIPKRQAKTLFQILIGILIIGLVVLEKLSPFFLIFGLTPPSRVIEYLHISLFYSSLAIAYLITYSAIEVDSPSLIMMMAIAKTGSNGLDRNKFEQTMTDDLLIMPRIRDLVIDKMIYLEGDRYRLSTKGLIVARIFVYYRKILIAGKGG